VCWCTVFVSVGGVDVVDVWVFACFGYDYSFFG
jgi:hypothetical protein